MKKRWMSLCLSLLLSVAFVPNWSEASAGTSQSLLMVNGNPVSTPSMTQKDRLMVPARIFQQINVAVTWNPEYKSAVLKNNGMLLSLPSGKKYADYYDREAGKWRRDNLATTTVNKNGKIYIPLRYAAEKLGMKVSYDAKLSRVYIKGATASRSYSVKAENDLYWLYQLTEAEAGGESHEGKMAVAATVLNRVKSPDWPNTIKDVIFQVVPVNGINRYQYSPVLDKRIHNVTPSKDTIAAVQEAVNGEDPTGGAMVFYNPDKTSNQWVRSRTVTATIGHHVFAR